MTDASILAVHGAGGGAWEWTIWQRIFGDRLHAIDLQPADGGLASTTFEDYRDHVIATQRQLGAPSLIGASLGGLLALHAAQACDLERLVLVNPALPDGGADASGGAIRHWTRSPASATLRALPDGDWYAARAAQERWRDESGAVMDALANGRPCRSPACPTLVIAAEFDRDVPLPRQRELALRIGADVQTLPGASHLGALLGAAAPCAARWAAEFIDGRRPGGKEESLPASHWERLSQ